MWRRRLGGSAATRLGGPAATRLGGSAATRLGGSAATRLGGWMSALRRVFGMPDYGAYLNHLRACHPDHPVPTEREYFDLYVKSRYGDGPTRCC